jgi:hypothetical protein
MHGRAVLAARHGGAIVRRAGSAGAAESALIYHLSPVPPEERTCYSSSKGSWGAKVCRVMAHRWHFGFWWFCVFASLGVLVAGCGGGNKLPPLAEVSGTVTLDGVPLPGAVVQFIPDATNGTQGPPAVGGSDQNGHYELMTVKHKGAAIGLHKVKVTMLNRPRGTASNAAPAGIPRRYSDPQTSGFQFEVKKVNKGESNVFDLPLKSAP